jgi:tetratricopeptide (TPR) repeat protein
LLLADNRLDEGIAALQRARVLLPDNKDIQATLASAIKAQSARPNLAALQRAVAENPKNALAHYRLGEAYKHYGKFAEAFAEFRTAYELAPNQFEAMLEYAFALQEQKRYEEALHVYQKFYADKPDSQEKHFYLGSTYYQLKQYAAAIPHFVKVLDINPNATFSAWLLALCYEATGQLKQAIAALEHLLIYDSNNSSAWHELGLLYLHQKQPEKAVQCHEKLQTLNPGMAESLGRKLEGK